MPGILTNDDYRLLIHNEVERRRAQDRKYSLRFFSMKMGMSEAYLKQVVSGKRSLTAEKAFLLAQALGFTAVERNYLITLCLKDKAESKALKQYFSSLATDLQRQRIPYSEKKNFISVFSDALAWEIYSLVGIDDFQNNPTWIAAKLNRPKLKAEQVATCMKRLIAIGAVDVDDQGRCKANSEIIKHNRDLAVVYKAALNRSVKYLEDIGVDKKAYFDSFCLILNEDQYEKISSILEDTKQRIAAIAKERHGKSMIAFFNSNLFPVSRS